MVECREAIKQEEVDYLTSQFQRLAAVKKLAEETKKLRKDKVFIAQVDGSYYADASVEVAEQCRRLEVLSRERLSRILELEKQIKNIL